MADLKISQLTGATTPLAGTEVLPIVQSGATKQVSVANLTAGRTQTSNGVIQGTAGTGYNFTANTPAAGMTSQLLNWYEEGTWTPVLSDGTNNATMDAQTAGSYTRVGNRVFINAYITTSSLGSVSGNLRVTGLPFTVADSNNAVGNGVAGYGVNFNLASGESVSFRTVKNTTYMVLEVWGGTAGSAAMTSTKWTNTGGILVDFSYRV